MPLACDAVVLDLDGTLVDTLGDFHTALQRMLTGLSLAPIAPEEVVRLIGKGSEHLVRGALASRGTAAERVEEALAAYQAHYGEVNGLHAKPYPGTHEALAELRALGLPLVCLTNKPTRFARELLLRLGLLEHFQAVHGGDAFERRKPDPLPLLRICASLALAPARVWMVGDSVNDAQAARAAGCPVALVDWGYNHGEPVQAAPHDLIVSRWSDLIGRLQG